MAEPGDPRTPADHPDDHDDLIGFSSAESLQGRAREVEPAPKPEPVIAMAEPEPAAAPEPAPDLFAPRAEVDPVPVAMAAPKPAQADSIFEPSPEFATRPRGRQAPPDAPGSMGLYAVYALILFAVPTLGVSAVIGLLAVTGREGPEAAMSRSHFVYQQRTLWAAAVAAVAGVILLAAPFALGVPVLFLLALWTVIRGASGVWNLKSGKPISDPRSWWI